MLEAVAAYENGCSVSVIRFNTTSCIRYIMQPLQWKSINIIKIVKKIDSHFTGVVQPNILYQQSEMSFHYVLCNHMYFVHILCGEYLKNSVCSNMVYKRGTIDDPAYTRVPFVGCGPFRYKESVQILYDTGRVKTESNLCRHNLHFNLVTWLFN